MEFDLDALFSLNYSFDKLKEVLAYLLGSNKQLALKLGELDSPPSHLYEGLNVRLDLNTKERVRALETTAHRHSVDLHQIRDNLFSTRRQIEYTLT